MKKLLLLGLIIGLFGCKAQNTTTKPSSPTTNVGIPATPKQMLTADWEVMDWKSPELAEMMGQKAYENLVAEKIGQQYRLDVAFKMSVWDAENNFVDGGEWEYNIDNKTIVIKLQDKREAYEVKEQSKSEVKLEMQNQYEAGKKAGLYRAYITWEKVKQ